MTDIRDELDQIKARLDARVYAIVQGDEQEKRITITASQADVAPLLAALEAVLDHEPESFADEESLPGAVDLPERRWRTGFNHGYIAAAGNAKFAFQRACNDMEAHDDDQWPARRVRPLTTQPPRPRRTRGGGLSTKVASESSQELNTIGDDIDPAARVRSWWHLSKESDAWHARRSA